MGRKGKWFGGVVKKVFTPEPKEKKENGWKTEKLKSIEPYPGSTSENGNGTSGGPTPVPVVDVHEQSVEQQQSKVVPQVATADVGAATVEVTVEAVHPTPTTSMFHGKAKKEVAATMIQTAFRDYQARKGLPAPKGLVRLKSLVDGYATKRQITTTLHCMQTLSRVQSRIQARRIALIEEKQALQQLRRKQELEALKASMGDEWEDSLQSKEQIDASLSSKHDAAMRRERAMAYSFSHQRKNTLKSGYPLFTDLNNPNWQWSCLEQLREHEEGTTTTEKESSIDQASTKSTVPSHGVEITNAPAKWDANMEKQSIVTQKVSRHVVPHALTTATTKALPMANSPTSVGPPQKGGQITSEEDDSRSVLSDTNHPQTLPRSTFRDDENHMNRPATPNYMTPTLSARAKSRLNNPSNEVEGPDRASKSPANKRLSMPTAGKYAMPSPARRHSGPPRVSVSPTKIAHSNGTTDTTQVV